MPDRVASSGATYKELMQKVIIIVGPTASGKTSLSIALAKKFGGEVISADSRQVYRGLNLGTGKVTKREMDGIPHHLLDVASPKRAFSAQDFVDQAHAAIEDIASRGKLPIIAGGTGFYIDALVGRIALPDVAPDEALRARLQKKTAHQLYAQLVKKDPQRAAMMDTPSERNNKVRLIRALEIASNKKRAPATAYPQKSPRSDLGAYPQAEYCWIGIKPDMEMLDSKIRVRLRERIAHGMINEARTLHAGGLSYKRMTELGLEYRSLAGFLQGKSSRSEMEEELYHAIRRYAHKQLGYWRRNKEIAWFAPAKSLAGVERKVKAFMNDH